MLEAKLGYHLENQLPEKSSERNNGAGIFYFSDHLNQLEAKLGNHLENQFLEKSSERNIGAASFFFHTVGIST
jgi:hypothetical protein